MRLKNEFRKETTIKKSVFIACVRTCRSETEAREYIDEIRREFTDATHVCTAYVTGANSEIRRSSDNHEPSGTAGVPMLEAILKSEVTDVCACVVRYFGGVKLGAGGLIRAYSGAVSEALKEAPKVRDAYFDRWMITYPYDLSGTVETWLRRYTEIVDLSYDEQVTCVIDTDRTDIPDSIRDLSRGTVTPEFLETVSREVDV